jgi:exosortase C (VPDSG-CTERM-specific)
MIDFSMLLRSGRDRKWCRFGCFALAWSLAFSVVLTRLGRHALSTELVSYIPLIPLISGYLLFTRRAQLVPMERLQRGAYIAAWTAWGIAGALVALNLALTSASIIEGTASALCLPVVGYVIGLIGGFIFTFGLDALRPMLFPLLFLFFLVPIPEPLSHVIRIGLQRCSADVAHAMFVLTGTTLFRDGLVFHLPGLTIQVAEECSGINSSVALFITSIVAAAVFLSRPWSRIILVLAVFPLGVLRNGFRVLSITLLTLHVDPRIIDSPLHHRGGPIFFAGSLVVFLGLLLMLRKFEKSGKEGCK